MNSTPVGQVGNLPHKRRQVGNLPHVVAIAALLIAAGCGPRDAAESGGRLVVVTAVEPVAGLVERIGGPRVEVHAIVPAGADPHTFQLAPKQAAALARARLYFKPGLPIEDRLLDKIAATNAGLTVVDTAEGIARRKMTSRECCAGHGTDEDRGTDGEYAPPGDAGADPHIWLSPLLLKIQAGHIAAALAEADPEGAQAYQENLAALLADLDALDARIRRRLASCKGRTFYVFHPAFGYFADAYGLKQAAVEAEGKVPSARQLRELVAEAKADRVTTIFAQPQFDPRAAQTVAEQVGARVVTVNDLDRDVLAALDDLSGKVAEALGATP